MAALLCGLALLAGCASAPSAPTSGAPGAAPSPATALSSRTLNMATRLEPAYLTQKPIGSKGIAIMTTARIFNAFLAYRDEQAVPHPYLAESLPELNTDSWQVFPDGTMQTTWRLKPNLTWHDGQPLTADDFVFAWQVYMNPSLSTSGSPPQNIMDNATAPDPSTLVIHYSQPYPDAGALWDSDGLPPLPRHILGPLIDAGDADAFNNNAYWNHEYVSAGPYRLEQWVTGASIDASAFDAHVLGRPKIERIHLAFIGDPNSLLAAMLAGTVDIAVDDSLRFEQGSTLRKNWGQSGGTVLFNPNNLRFTQFQFRQDIVNPRALLDLRVRQALAYSVDRQALNDGIFQGQGLPADVPITNQVSYYPEIDRAITKYPFDPRRADQLFTDAGFSKDADGFYANPGSGRFSPDLDVIAGNAQNEQEQAIMVDTWRHNGIDVQSSQFPLALQQDGQARSSFTGMASSSGLFPRVSALLDVLRTAVIPRPENHWAGSNRGGWSNSDFDRFADLFSTSLDSAQRAEDVVQMNVLVTQQLPLLSLYYNFESEAYDAALSGPVLNNIDGTPAWNVYQWELH